MRKYLPAILFVALAAALLTVSVGVGYAAVDGEAFRYPFQPAGGLYVASPSTIADGEHDELRLTSSGLLRTSDEGTSAVAIAAALGATTGNEVTTDANGTVQQYLRGLIVLGQAASPDANAAVTADVDAAVAASAGLRLVGWSIRESKSSAAVATGRITNGATGASGTVVANIELAADTSQTFWLGSGGIACPNGISVDWIAGEFDITLYYIDTE